MASAIEGKLNQFPDFADMLRTRRETGELILRHANRQVFLFFKDGILIHATDGKVSGDTPIYEATSWKEGTFSFTPGLVNVAPTIDAAQNYLLFESIALMRAGQKSTPEASPKAPPARPKIQRSDGTFQSLALPIGEILHANLKTTFVTLSALVEELKAGALSGSLILRAEKNEGIMLFHKGLVSDVFFYTHNGQVLLGEKATHAFLNSAKNPNGEINVSKLSEEFLASYTSLLYGHAVHQNLDSRVIKFGSLVRSLQEESFSGSVFILPPGDITEGYIFFYDGRFLGGYYRSGNVLLPGLDQVGRMVSVPNTRISVFKTAPPSKGAASFALTPISQKQMELLTTLVQRFHDTIIDLSGANKANAFLTKSINQPSSRPSWSSALKFSKEGKIDFSEVDFSTLTLAEAVLDTLGLLNHYFEQGQSVFGKRVVASKLQKTLNPILDPLVEMGFPANWLKTK